MLKIWAFVAYIHPNPASSYYYWCLLEADLSLGQVLMVEPPPKNSGGTVTEDLLTNSSSFRCLEQLFGSSERRELKTFAVHYQLRDQSQRQLPSACMAHGVKRGAYYCQRWLQLVRDVL